MRDRHDAGPGRVRGVSRRQVSGVGGALGLMAVTGLSASAALSRRPPSTGAELRSAVPLPPAFRVPLPLPSVAAPVGTTGGADRYEITQREATLEILPGGLPAGARELPLMITDRAFVDDGSLAYPALDPALRGRPGVREPCLGGVLGDVILVNGAPWPVHEVDAARYRLRVLNGSNARHYALEAVGADGRRLDLVQIGADQGLLAAPVTHHRLPVAPAERYDVVVDFSHAEVGSLVRVVNRLGTGRTRDVMAFRVVREARGDSRVPRTLSTDLPAWRRSDAVQVRDFAFRAGRMRGGHGWLIGGLPFDPARSDVTVDLGDVEVWRLIADAHHLVHLHLVGFRVLSRNGRPPLAHDAGLKDTVSPRPGEAVEIITRFDGCRGRYLFHCHNAEHEDMGMMANLEVV
ncbi:multicopper oxidase family protein [Streptomyces sp. MN13]